MVLILHQSGVPHGNGHRPNQHQQQGHCNHGNASVRAAFIHVVGDLVQSVGVLLAAAIIHFWPEYKVADPICTFLFSALVLGTTFPVTKDVFRVLMEGKKALPACSLGLSRVTGTKCSLQELLGTFVSTA